MLFSIINRVKHVIVTSCRSRFSRKHAANSVLQAVALSQGTTVEAVRAELATTAATAAKAKAEENVCATELRTSTAAEQAAVVLSAQELYAQIVADAQAALDQVHEAAEAALVVAEREAQAHETNARVHNATLAQINAALSVI